MTILQELAVSDAPPLLDLLDLEISAATSSIPLMNGFDNQPTWDNASGGGGFDNRPSWDNWSKK
jgi:hypothetical protein